MKRPIKSTSSSGCTSKRVNEGGSYLRLVLFYYYYHYYYYHLFYFVVVVFGGG